MQSPTILKLGGSILTEKASKKPVLRAVAVKRLAREVARSLRGPLILLHGAGSFGHPLAHKYKLKGRSLSREALKGVAQTTAAVRALNTALIESLIACGLPAVPIQASSLFEERGGTLVCKNIALVEDVLAAGGVPVIGGDVVIADHTRIEIASADRLAVFFAQHFKSSHMLFATDVDGVYATYPPRVGERPLEVLGRKDLGGVATKKVVAHTTDVTGAMGGKLSALLSLRNCSVQIFNGLTPSSLISALKGKRVGTKIAL